MVGGSAGGRDRDRVPPDLAHPDPLEATAPAIDVSGTIDLPRLREDVRGLFAGSAARPETVQGFVSAVSEATTNAVTHGWPPVRVRVWSTRHRSVCTVLDHGDGIDDPCRGGAAGSCSATLHTPHAPEAIVTPRAYVSAGLEEAEVPLLGGDMTEGVVRVGRTVRRPVRPHTAAVHGLLRHLEAAGFDGAPRVLGIDAKNREVLTYLAGVVARRPLPAFATADSTLAALARCSFAITRRWPASSRHRARGGTAR